MTQAWSDLIGHQQVRQWLETAIRRGRLSGSFLFVGPPGVGKTFVAELLARTLLCETLLAGGPTDEIEPCGHCESCRLISAGTHPDLVRVSKPADRSQIPLELLVGPADARMQAGFCRDIRLKPLRGSRKVAILEDADLLNEEGANCLLKTLEEPPAGALIILVGTSEQRQLPTIRSRCRLVRFAAPRGVDAIELIRRVHHVEETAELINAACEIAGGDLQAAARILAGDSRSLHDALSGELALDHPDPIAIRRMLTSYVEEAGKDANLRRTAMRDALSIAIQLYRARLRADARAHQIEPLTLRRLDRSIQAIREVDRSANQSTLIECYAADLAAGTTGDRGEIG